MDGMGEIRIPGSSVLEKHHKTVREALAKPFGARVYTPREIQNAGNFPWKILHDSPDIGDVLRGAGVLELEECDVFDAFHGR